jgi:protein-tyrosine phosphatase
MIDIHCHILPGVDDGPDQLDESLKMLKEAAAQGITTICATPHVDGWANGRTEMMLNNRLNELRAAAAKHNIPVKIDLGSEIYFGVGIETLKTYSFSTLAGNGKYWLVEFSTDIFPAIVENFVSLSVSWGITPILAHVERYSILHRRTKYLEDIIKAGALIQVDAGCFVGQHGRHMEKRCQRMVTQNLCHIVASDAHNIDSKPFLMKGAYKVVSHIAGANTAKRLFNDNPLAILHGRELAAYKNQNQDKPSAKSA